MASHDYGIEFSIVLREGPYTHTSLIRVEVSEMVPDGQDPLAYFENRFRQEYDRVTEGLEFPLGGSPEEPEDEAKPAADANLTALLSAARSTVESLEQESGARYSTANGRGAVWLENLAEQLQGAIEQAEEAAEVAV